MYTDSIGHILTEARNRAGKSVKEVEFDTKIRAKFIEALERDDYASVPSNIYTQGFIKTYASYLNLDPEPLIQQYKSEHGSHGSDLSQLSANIRVKTKRRPRWFTPAVVAGAILGIFVLLIAWGAWQQNAARDPQVIVQDIKTKQSPASTVAAVTTSTTKRKNTSEENSIPNGDGKLDVIVKLTGMNDVGSWVRVTIDGEKAYEGLIQAGATKVFKGDASVRIRVGNLKGLEVLFYDKRIKDNDFKISSGIADKTFTADMVPSSAKASISTKTSTTTKGASGTSGSTSTTTSKAKSTTTSTSTKTSTTTRGSTTTTTEN